MNKKLIELNRKYWNEIIPMAEKYNIDPWKLVRVKCYKTNRVIDKLPIISNHPGFSDYINDSDSIIEFAKIVVENSPVFFLDELYDKSGRKIRFNHLMLVFPGTAIVAVLDDNGVFKYNTTVNISELTWKPSFKSDCYDISYGHYMKIKYTIEFCEDDITSADIEYAKENGIESYDSLINFLHVNNIAFEDFLVAKTEYFKDKNVKLLNFELIENSNENSKI
jgi:hypothetical protein